jgi:hypothetical protein
MRQRNPPTPTAPGEGERRAQRGYGTQYTSSAAAVYTALERDGLTWIGIADRSAGIADDIVIGLPGRIVGHQFKTSNYPTTFRLRTLLLGADGLLLPLVHAWQKLRQSSQGETIEVRLVTNDIPATKDHLIKGQVGHSAEFLREFELFPNRPLIEWQSSKWRPFIDELAQNSKLESFEFEQFLGSLRILHGPAADFVMIHRLSTEATRLAREIADILPQLVADPRDKDRWTRGELLQRLGWRDPVFHRSHQFPVGAYVQRNLTTERALLYAIKKFDTGYIALVGPPGSGKSTLLQSSLASLPNFVVVRYLAFIPGEGQGVGRGEAESFLDDINNQLKPSQFIGYRSIALQDRRDRFGEALKHAADRFQQHGVRTVIVVDGLDHVPREEEPDRSLLAEFPVTSAIPAGILFVLGTQRTDLADLKPSVREQASCPNRQVIVASLLREAVYRMVDALKLDSAISRERIFELSCGQPLVTRYVIEALRGAEKARQESILAGEFAFEGDIENIYAAAWRDIQNDADACDVMGYIARAEGPIQPELLAEAVSEQALDRAYGSTRHLLAVEPHGWRLFHNSFRIFILSKPRLRFGVPDPEHSLSIYRRLAELALKARADSPQRWLELRYSARAQLHEKVLSLALPERFRQQLANGRPAAEIQADIRLVFASAKEIGGANIFRLLLARDEIDRRATALGYATGVVEAMLALGDVAGAQAYAQAADKAHYEIVDALLQTGEVDQARSLFDQIEPLGPLLGSGKEDLNFHFDDLLQWAKRVFYFRDVDQIDRAITLLSKNHQGSWMPNQDDEYIERRLRLTAAFAAILIQPEADFHELACQLRVRDADMPYLLIHAGIHAYESNKTELADKLLSQATTHSGFSSIENGWKRTAALVEAKLGKTANARAIFVSMTAPTIATMDRATSADTAATVASDVMEYAELSTLLGETSNKALPSRRPILQPLQHLASLIGNFLGRSKSGGSIHSGEVVRAARNVLTYLEQGRVHDSDEIYASHQIEAAAPVLARGLIQVAARCGRTEFENLIAVFDHSFSLEGSKNSRRTNLRRQVIEEVFRWNGDVEGACRRLESLVSELRERTPESQVDGLAAFAVTFVLVGNPDRARELLDQIHGETLGYALAPKKDPQYVLWRDLLKRANLTFPERRQERIEVMMRTLDGMMETEGRSSACRIAPDVLTEAVMVDATTGLTAAQKMVERGMLGWSGLVNALLLGIILRRPDLATSCIVTWISLCLPHYNEPFYRSSKLGKFVSISIAAANENDLGALVQHLNATLEAESQPTVRASLIRELINAANLRGVKSTELDEALLRWRDEIPEKLDSGTPGAYDDLSSLDALEEHLRADGLKEPAYSVASAFVRLVSPANLDEARAMFRRWPQIHTDSSSRFVLFELAVAKGETSFARQLLDEYREPPGERSTWSHWTGAGRLKYYQARLKLDGKSVCTDAYSDLVEELAKGREYPQSILVDFEDVFTTILSSPDWQTMWEDLATQLRVTREYALGKPFETSGLPLTDEDLIVELYRWALSLSVSEQTWHAKQGALQLLSVQGGASIFELLARRLINGERDEPAEAMQLLTSRAAEQTAVLLSDTVATLVDHPDYAVAVPAARLCKRWNRTTEKAPGSFPAFYRIHLDGDEASFEPPATADSTSGAMRVEEVFGWTFAFPQLIKSLSRSEISSEQIRRRCCMFIEKWGGLKVFGQSSLDKLKTELRRLDLQVPFFKPHITVAARAIRHVAGELRQAGLIGHQDESWLLHMMGFPADRLAPLSPAVRPNFLRMPPLDRNDYSKEQTAWFSAFDDDVRPLASGNAVVIAEFSQFNYRQTRKMFSLERARVPLLGAGVEPDPSQIIYDLPQAVWVDGIIALGYDPAPTIVRRFEEKHFFNIPRHMFVICPLWLKRLFWRQHPDNWLIYLDGTGKVVANIVWWRDGGPIDIDEDATWAEGVFVTVTPEGRAQIESVVGHLNIYVHARRTFSSELGDADKWVSTVERA